MALLVTSAERAKIDSEIKKPLLLNQCHSRNTQATQVTQATQATQATQVAQLVEVTHSTETTQTTQTTQIAHVIQSAQSAQSTQSTQTTQITQPTESIEAMRNVLSNTLSNESNQDQTGANKNYLKIECKGAPKDKNNDLTSKNKESTTIDNDKDKSKSKVKSKIKAEDETLEEIIKIIEEDKSVVKSATTEGNDFIEIDPKKLDLFYQEIANLFSQEQVEELAKDSGFVKRKSKLTGHLFMTIFTFGVNIYGSPTLNQLVGLLDSIAHIDIKRQALHKRITKDAVTFFEEMLSLSIKVSLPDGISINVLDAFNRVMILDSTSFQLPKKLAPFFAGCGGSASPAGIKIQFAYDLKSSQFICLIQDGKTPDNRYSNSLVKYMNPGDLAIKDLGYSNTQAFIDLDKKDVYIFSRLKSDLKVYVKDDKGGLKEFDLDQYLSKMSVNLCELEVYLKKDNQKILVRLVIEKVPQEVKDTRLRKRKEANQKKGKTTSKRTKLREGFNLYISNVPAKMARFTKSEYENFKKRWTEVAKILEKYTYERREYIYIDLVKGKEEVKLLKNKKCLKLIKEKEISILEAKGFRYIYKVRWQIELIFKNWKSNFDLESIRVKNNEHLAKCLIYAKLMYILISTKITYLAKSLLWKQEKKELSELQSGQHLKVIAFNWLFFSIYAPYMVVSMLKRAVKFMMNKCVKSKKKGELWPLEILQMIGMFV